MTRPEALDPEAQVERALLLLPLAVGALVVRPGVRRYRIRYPSASLLSWLCAEGALIGALVLWINGAPTAWFGIASGVFVLLMVVLFPRQGAMAHHDGIIDGR